MRSAFVTPTTAMLFSTRDFPFFLKQKNNVSNFKTSRPLHGAISRLLTLPGRFSFCQKSCEIGRSLLQWRPSVSVFVPAASWPCSRLVGREEHCNGLNCAGRAAKCTEVDCWLALIYGFIDGCSTSSTTLISFLRGGPSLFTSSRSPLPIRFMSAMETNFQSNTLEWLLVLKFAFSLQKVHSNKSTIYWHGLFIYFFSLNTI